MGGDSDMEQKVNPADKVERWKIERLVRLTIADWFHTITSELIQE